MLYPVTVTGTEEVYTYIGWKSFWVSCERRKRYMYAYSLHQVFDRRKFVQGICQSIVDNLWHPILVDIYFILFTLLLWFFHYLIYSIVSFHDLLRTTGSMLILKGTMEEQNRYEKLWLLHVILYNYCIPVKYKTDGLYRSGI